MRSNWTTCFLDVLAPCRVERWPCSSLGTHGSRPQNRISPFSLTPCIPSARRVSSKIMVYLVPRPNDSGSQRHIRFCERATRWSSENLIASADKRCVHHCQLCPKCDASNRTTVYVTIPTAVSYRHARSDAFSLWAECTAELAE